MQHLYTICKIINVIKNKFYYFNRIKCVYFNKMCTWLFVYVYNFATGTSVYACVTFPQDSARN